ncbi:MAG: flagellar hook-associated protein FlgK [Xanthobacteraceae bacterium]|nr:flagellar hook-associated protein FlgK [Xanthobacteraceae bacterium]QYK44083.1 MAG: flagellar hook-associated protein FlgK [Xanthobacteraceae bacterium]
MGLTTALSSALSGLRATQTGINVVATNVANAETPGYSRKTLSLETALAGGSGIGVRVANVNRELDIYVQRQLRTELAGSNYIDTIAQVRQQIDRMYGQPGSASALDTIINSFTSSLQALSADPQSVSTRQAVLNAAQVMAQKLHSLSNDVTLMRNQAESGIGDAVERVNGLLKTIENVQTQIIALSSQDVELGALLDQRDAAINELAGLIDIQVTPNGANNVSIFTNSGVSLFDMQASQLAFDEKPLSAQSMWNANPALSGAGTIRLVSPSGYSQDLIADGSIRSGKIAALLELRDDILVKAQAQLDEIAHSLAASLSSRTVASTNVSSGLQTGFQIDLADLQNGNSISLTYTDNSGPTTHRVTIVRVDDPSSLPLSNSLTADPGDEVIGISFAGGVAGALAALNTALGPSVQFDNPSGSILRVLDDGAPNLVNIDALSANVTTNTVQSGDGTLPFFVDGSGNSLYTNVIDGGRQQKVGFAARIAVNSALLNDSSGLINIDANTLPGDSTRPEFLWQRLTAANQMFSPSTGIGGTGTPFSGSVVGFAQQIITYQSTATENALRLKDGQDVVLNSLQDRMAESTGVNIDSEMARLLQLQNAYAANARVMTAVKELFELLIRV